ncbi:MAG: HAMP domain-containing histidine kinase, partial [Boseongicola sp. SB0665_bin_10]|nr:HAMP domain-containing histidine kinase [Boseongicola sp. SB0665_bin_10]
AVEIEGVAFTTEVPSGMTLRADAEQLYRVLSNLIRNARQAIEATKSDGCIRVSAAEDDACWRIEVSDTGPGLPPRARENLFTPFQGGASKGGAGLGLAIAAELVRGHGGQLSLGETGPEGTTFVVTLPKAVIDVDQAV